MLNPQLTLSTNTYDASNQEVVASVKVYNRPDYEGKPEVSGLTTITPVIVCSRVPSGQAYFHLMVSAKETTANTGNPYLDLHYEWDFGDPSGVEVFTDHYNGSTVNANNSQTGPEASYIYRNPGTYTVRLTVKGKDENGNLITASTTNIKTVGTYALFKRYASSGTFTLSVNGQTTSPLAYNIGTSGIVTALRGLSTVGSGNCNYNYQSIIEFNRDLTGQNISFSGNFSGTTMGFGSAKIRTECPSTTSSVVTVTNSWSAQYFDSNYDGSNGASNGTQSRPYTTWSAIRTWLHDNSADLYRIAYIKRGSSFTASSILWYSRSNKGIRVLPYGSGAKPILNFSSNVAMGCEQAWSLDSDSDISIGGDFLFSGLDLRQSGPYNMFWSYPSDNGNGNTYTAWKNIIFDNCDYTVSYSGSSSADFLNLQVNVNNRGTCLGGFHSWNCNINAGGAGGQGFGLIGLERWMSAVGGSIYSGDGNIVYDHHVYSNTLGHQLYRYIRFGYGVKNFCLNMNVQNGAGASPYFLCDGCDVTGTQNGMDFSNTNNDQGLTGHFDQVVVQFCKIHVGQAGSQKIAVYGHNIFRTSIRYCDFWGNRGGNLYLLSNRPNVYLDLSMYGCNMYDGESRIYPPQRFYMRNNKFYVPDAPEAWNNYYIFRVYNNPASLSIDSKNNIYYAPFSVTPFASGDGSATISWATWQAAGKDTQSYYQDTQFYLPQSGIFIKNPRVKVDWPSSFSNLEYNNGSSWVSYTDNTYNVFASGISGVQTVDFRARTGSENGQQTVYVYGSGLSIDQQSDFDYITGTIGKYQIINFGSNLLAIRIG